MVNKKDQVDTIEKDLVKIWQKCLFRAAQMVNEVAPFLAEGGRIITIASCAEKKSNF